MREPAVTRSLYAQVLYAPSGLGEAFASFLPVKVLSKVRTLLQRRAALHDEH